MLAESTILTTMPLGNPEAVLFVLFAAGVTAMTAVAFVLWIGWLTMKGLVVIATRLSIWPGRRASSGSSEPAKRACPDPVCRTVNPAAARYCRHCGRMLTPPRPL